MNAMVVVALVLLGMVSGFWLPTMIVGAIWLLYAILTGSLGIARFVADHTMADPSPPNDDANSAAH